MQKKEGRIQNGAQIILRILFFSVLFLGVSIMVAGAQGENNEEILRNESIYNYNALEREISYLSIGEIIDNQNKISPENEEESINIKEKMEEVINSYNQSEKLSEEIMTDIGKKDGVGSFLLGTALGKLRFQLVQIKGRIHELEALAEKTENYWEENEIYIQIEKMEQEKNKVDNFILARENKFSLFGWFVSIL